MARHKKSDQRSNSSVKTSLDYHEGLSANQVEIILREYGLGHLFHDFNGWMYGQTGPVIERHNRDTGKLEKAFGVYEYDLFRWIHASRSKTQPIFD